MLREAVKKIGTLGMIPKPVDPPAPLDTFRNKNVTFGQKSQVIKAKNNGHQKGLTLVQALWGRVGAKGCWRIFFKNPTTQLRVVWGLTEKKCEQTPKFACFNV